MGGQGTAGPRHLQRGVIFCKPDTPLHEVVRIMADGGIHAVMVAEHEGEAPMGVVSHTDAIAHWRGTGGSACSRRDDGVLGICENEPVTAAVRKLLEGINRLLVVSEEGKPLGILSTTDIIRAMHDGRWVWHFR